MRKEKLNQKIVNTLPLIRNSFTTHRKSPQQESYSTSNPYDIESHTTLHSSTVLTLHLNLQTKIVRWAIV